MVARLMTSTSAAMLTRTSTAPGRCVYAFRSSQTELKGAPDCRGHNLTDVLPNHLLIMQTLCSKAMQGEEGCMTLLKWGAHGS